VTCETAHTRLPSSLLPPLQATLSDSRKSRNTCENARAERSSLENPTWGALVLSISHTTSFQPLRSYPALIACNSRAQSTLCAELCCFRQGVDAFPFLFAGIVSSHDAFHRTQESLEAVLAECRNFDLGRADNGGGAGGIVEQGQLAKVIALLVPIHRLLDAALEDFGLSALKDVKGLAHVALFDDGCAGRVLLCLESVGNLGALVRREGGEKRDFLQEALVHAASLEGAVHENATERDAVQGPQGGLLGCDDGRSARRVVHEGQLAEGPSGPHGADLCTQAIGAGFQLARFVDVDVERALFDHVEVVAHVALRNDLDSLCWYGLLLQGAEDLGRLLVVEVREEKVARDGGSQAGLLLVGLVVEGRGPVVVGGRGGVERLGGHGGAPVHVVVAGERLRVGRSRRGGLRAVGLCRRREAREVAKGVLARGAGLGVVHDVGCEGGGGGGGGNVVGLLLFGNVVHVPAGRRRAKGIAAGKGALGLAALLAGMLVRELELGALGLEAAQEEVGAELQDVARVLVQDLAVEGGDFIEVVGRKRH
jgi:hypothetical protein